MAIRLYEEGVLMGEQRKKKRRKEEERTCLERDYAREYNIGMMHIISREPAGVF
jgi:hypothetical protein